MAPSAHSPSYSPAYSPAHSPARTRIHLRIRILRRYGTGTAARASSIPATLSSSTFSQRTCSVSIRHINFSFTTNLNLQLLTSCHWLATVGAQHLHAGLSRCVRRFLPAPRADANSVQPRGRGFAHSSCSRALSSALPAPAASAARAHSKTCWHRLFSFLPAASLAARHYECPIRKAVVQISSQYFVDHPAGKTDHLHTGGHQSAL